MVILIDLFCKCADSLQCANSVHTYSALWGVQYTDSACFTNADDHSVSAHFWSTCADSGHYNNCNNNNEVTSEMDVRFYAMMMMSTVLLRLFLYSKELYNCHVNVR